MARILVVDDEPVVREIMREMLEERGHEVDEAGNGAQGISRYVTRPADGVITDILMPEGGGLNLIRDLRARFPRARLVAISGGGRDGRVRFLTTAKSYPGVRTVSKPFTQEQLLAAVNAVLADGGPIGRRGRGSHPRSGDLSLPSGLGEPPPRFPNGPGCYS
jgi:CheY-like chemotaxis protein